jgi:transcription elongation GreA/GreB family factor
MPTQGHAAVLSIETERTDMRFQWIARVLADPLLDSVSVMEPFARQLLGERRGRPRT